MSVVVLVNKIEMFRGTSESFSVEIKDAESGEIYTPSESDIVVFGVRSAGSNVLLLKKQATVSGDGVMVTLQPEDTADLYGEFYLYDVGMTTSEGFYNIIPISPFIIKNGVTEMEIFNE